MAAWKVISKYLDGQRVVYTSLGLLLLCRGRAGRTDCSRLRLSVTGAVCLLFCLMCPLWHEYSHAKGGENKAADQLVIEPKTVDFGRVNDAKNPLELSFTIANRGDQPIEITRARSGCGCTVAKLSKSIVPPHDQIAVSVKVNILGRRGDFKNRVLLDVAGQTEPVVVPIQGTIIQDLWFNGPLIQCFLTDSAPKVEKNFEVHTVDWPSVQFDWKNLDKSISIKELSRSKIADETVIKFRLRMDAPTTQSTATRYIILTPFDKRIKSLTIPVVCYQPSLRKKEMDRVSHTGQNHGEKPNKTSPPLLKPDRISLGVVPRGEERRFEVSGPAELIKLLKVDGLDNFPEGAKVDFHLKKDLEKSLFEGSVYIGKSIPLGLFDGRIRLISPEGHKYSVAVLGIVGPEDPGKKSKETKGGQPPSKVPEGKLSSR